MSDDPVDIVRQAMKRSQLVRAIALSARDGGRSIALADSAVRPLYREEVAQLESAGNWSEDWSRVRVANGFDWRRVRYSSFDGDVLLGRFTGRVQVANGLTLPSGVYHSNLANCVIGHDALVQEVKLLANYIVGEAVLLWDCGSIVCDGMTAFGNGTELALGIETGGRNAPVYAEIDLHSAARLARSRGQPALLLRYQTAVADYVTRVMSGRGIVESKAIIRQTRQVQNSYIGPCTLVDGASQVVDCTVLSQAAEPVQILSGSCVIRSILQWGSRVATMAVVEGSVLGEQARVERHATVTASFLGPSTAVARGEVTACLLGPLVSLHHQALLIAAFWPEGKGNVAQGANVGSNHTSRAPDQEIWPGEGMFLGLGVNVKYPADFSRAPYTIIASGVSTLPQRVTLPFSLINTPSTARPGIPPAYNEIIPAWLLTDNLYALKRNEAKYRARHQGKRTPLALEVFRPETVDCMNEACQRLRAVAEPKDVYTERDLEGLGKNFLLESCRLRAVEAYGFFIRYYALRGLKDRVESLIREGRDVDLEWLLTTPSDQTPWEHQRHLLTDKLGVTDILSGLRQLPSMMERVAHAVEQSKARDDERGQRILEDYADAHISARDDPVVRMTWDETRRLGREVEQLITRLESTAGTDNGQLDHAVERQYNETVPAELKIEN